MKKITEKFLIKIGRGYQITIPKEIREALKLKIGDLLEATLDKKKQYLILRPIREIAPGIIKNKNIHHGKPVLKGTRVPPELVIGHLIGGMTVKEVMRQYDLTKKHIEAAVAYGLRKRKLSHGKAAEILGVDRWQFMDFMAAYQVPVSTLTSSELAAELKHLRRRSQRS